MWMIPTCEEMSRLVSRSRENRPGLWTRALMTVHLIMCSRCAAHKAQIDALCEAARQYDDFCGMADTGPGLPPEAAERIKADVRRCLTG